MGKVYTSVAISADGFMAGGVPPRRLELVGSRSASLVTHVTYRLPGQ